MIVLGAIALAIFIILGAATAIVLAADAVHEFRRWRLDRERRRVYRLPLPTCRVRWLP